MSPQAVWSQVLQLHERIGRFALCGLILEDGRPHVSRLFEGGVPALSSTSNTSSTGEGGTTAGREKGQDFHAKNYGDFYGDLCSRSAEEDALSSSSSTTSEAPDSTAENENNVQPTEKEKASGVLSYYDIHGKVSEWLAETETEDNKNGRWNETSRGTSTSADDKDGTKHETSTASTSSDEGGQHVSWETGSSSNNVQNQNENKTSSTPAIRPRIVTFSYGLPLEDLAPKAFQIRYKGGRYLRLIENNFFTRMANDVARVAVKAVDEETVVTGGTHQQDDPKDTHIIATGGTQDDPKSTHRSNVDKKRRYRFLNLLDNSMLLREKKEQLLLSADKYESPTTSTRTPDDLYECSLFQEILTKILVPRGGALSFAFVVRELGLGPGAAQTVFDDLERLYQRLAVPLLKNAHPHHDDVGDVGAAPSCSRALGATLGLVFPRLEMYAEESSVRMCRQARLISGVLAAGSPSEQDHMMKMGRIPEHEDDVLKNTIDGSSSSLGMKQVLDLLLEEREDAHLNAPLFSYPPGRLRFQNRGDYDRGRSTGTTGVVATCQLLNLKGSPSNRKMNAAGAGVGIVLDHVDEATTLHQTTSSHSWIKTSADLWQAHDSVFLPFLYSEIRKTLQVEADAVEALRLAQKLALEDPGIYVSTTPFNSSSPKVPLLGLSRTGCELQVVPDARSKILASNYAQTEDTLNNLAGIEAMLEDATNRLKGLQRGFVVPRLLMVFSALAATTVDIERKRHTACLRQRHLQVPNRNPTTKPAVKRIFAEVVAQLHWELIGKMKGDAEKFWEGENVLGQRWYPDFEVLRKDMLDHGGDAKMLNKAWEERVIVKADAASTSPSTSPSMTRNDNYADGGGTAEDGNEDIYRRDMITNLLLDQLKSDYAVAFNELHVSVLYSHNPEVLKGRTTTFEGAVARIARSLGLMSKEHPTFSDSEGVADCEAISRKHSTTGEREISGLLRELQAQEQHPVEQEKENSDTRPAIDHSRRACCQPLSEWPGLLAPEADAFGGEDKLAIAQKAFRAHQYQRRILLRPVVQKHEDSLAQEEHSSRDHRHPRAGHRTTAVADELRRLASHLDYRRNLQEGSLSCTPEISLAALIVRNVSLPNSREVDVVRSQYFSDIPCLREVFSRPYEATFSSRPALTRFAVGMLFFLRHWEIYARDDRAEFAAKMASQIEFVNQNFDFSVPGTGGKYASTDSVNARALANTRSRIQRLHVFLPRYQHLLNQFHFPVEYLAVTRNSRVLLKHFVKKGSLHSAEIALSLNRTTGTSTSGLASSTTDPRATSSTVKRSQENKEVAVDVSTTINIRVPKRLIQVGPMRETMRVTLPSRRQLPSDWDFWPMGDADCEKFIQENPIKEMPHALDFFRTKFIRGAHKGDFCVLFVLFQAGGVSIDSDVILQDGIETLVSDADFVGISAFRQIDYGILAAHRYDRAIYETLKDMYSTPKEFWTDVDFHYLAPCSMLFHHVHRLYQVPLMVANSDSRWTQMNATTSTTVHLPQRKNLHLSLDFRVVLLPSAGAYSEENTRVFPII
ncbi:unnamed protein product [Amoebophrya sp. A25]|nr:unnamed protein product [Amoebophrya sp. A25]|eukprot:GSA25T00007365001.1